jgi:predicted dienelactone hydrolase
MKPLDKVLLSRCALLPVAAGLLLALSLWTLGGEGWWHGAAETAWLGPAVPGPEPHTWRLEARLGNDRADVYLPETTTAHRLPVALVLQGANVDKRHYSTFAALLAREGFVVVVPNHWRTFPPLPLLGRRLLLADQRQIAANLAALRQLDASAPMPFRNGIDSRRLVVVGHSMGGLAGLETLAQRCRFPLCVGTLARPPELRGGVFVGTDLRGHGGGVVAPIDTDNLPVALIRGSRDGASKAADVQATWQQLRTPRRALLTLDGANHYAITNTSRPLNPPDLPAAHPDPNSATAVQRTTLEHLARWSGRFLREAVGDPQAASWKQTPLQP